MLTGVHSRMTHIEGDAALTEVTRQGGQQAGCLGRQLRRGGAPLPPQQQPQAVPGGCARLPWGFPARHRRCQGCQASGRLLPAVAACCNTAPIWTGGPTSSSPLRCSALPAAGALEEYNPCQQVSISGIPAKPRWNAADIEAAAAVQGAQGAYLRLHPRHHPSHRLVEDRRPSCVGGLRLWLWAGEMLWGAAGPLPGRGAAVAAQPAPAPADPRQSLCNDVPQHFDARLPGQNPWNYDFS